jgi:hypothetical protein
VVSRYVSEAETGRRKRIHLTGQEPALHEGAVPSSLLRLKKRLEKEPIRATGRDGCRVFGGGRPRAGIAWDGGEGGQPRPASLYESVGRWAPPDRDRKCMQGPAGRPAVAAPDSRARGFLLYNGSDGVAAESRTSIAAGTVATTSSRLARSEDEALTA